MPSAPPSRCTDPQCHALAVQRGRCDDHQPIPWAGRTNKAERYGISSGTWRKLKARVRRRDNGCCYMCGDADAEAYVLDHITPVSEGGSVTNLDNLGLACGPCDALKSKAEALRGNQRRQERQRGGPGQREPTRG
ncbi:HNH endonuclease [Kitasatospora indigofera]|uniref:HNH endonuclease n=1 Tax=Kitasatospora indigofera TaxID=67307 RepID=UPI0036829163